MPRRRSRSEVWDAAHQTAEQLHDQDEKAAAVAERASSSEAWATTQRVQLKEGCITKHFGDQHSAF